MDASSSRSPRRGSCSTALVLLLGACTTGAEQPARAAPDCQSASRLSQIAALPEASGLAVSRQTPGRFWSHNDSGEAEVFALDSRGAVTSRVRVTGAEVEDWEAIAEGPCPEGQCLYVGDIGDNDAVRQRVTIYRIPEPAGAEGSAAPSAVFHASYPEGPQDAETLLIGADGRMHIVTKGQSGPIAVYRFPSTLKPDAVVQLERMGPGHDADSPADRITDGDISPNGEWVVLRSNSRLMFYRAADLLLGNWRESSRVDLTHLEEPQGEGVAFGDRETLFLVGEGPAMKGGTFVRVTCTGLW
jgi:hypothetical protein